MSNKDQNNFEWENRDIAVPFSYQVIAGTGAGIIEHLTMLPVDNIKTHQQVFKEMNVFKVIKHIYNQGGFFNFYSGMSVLALGSIPAHVALFSIYEVARTKFKIGDDQLHPYLFGLVGVMATLGHDIFITPADVLKQRTQIMGQSTLKILRTMLKNEGVKSLYRSFPITFLTNGPQAAILIAVNESLKTILSQSQSISHHNFLSYFCCAGCAGAIAATLTTPLDVIKTKLQTQNITNKTQGQIEPELYSSVPQQMKITEQKPYFRYTKQEEQDLFKTIQKAIKFRFSSIPQPEAQTQRIKVQMENKFIKYKNIFSTIKIILQEEGLRGFLRGLGANIAIVAPSAAISWASYESIKKFLFKYNSDKKF